VRRVAVVTGASSGIGAEIARELSRRDWLCVLVARREDRLLELAGELGAEYELCDVSDREAVERVAAAVRERHPEVHALVNNAGVPARASFLAGDPEVIERAIRTNYLGGVWCTRAFLPALEAAAPSDVVNVVSVAGQVALPGSGPYAASKHAQLAFSRALAAELRRRGIRVHTVKPGFVETEGFPQAWLPGPLRRLVMGPGRVASHVAASLEHRRGESTVPRWYAPAAVLQQIVPNVFARVLGSRMGR
jgi:NAD(P)-dependent dehydrogenase (short-subunit alcohol dehydrogenase family)